MNRDRPLTLRQQQALASRKHILETALRLFARQGFDGTSTQQIAKEAGVADGLIFHYFHTKDQLLSAMLETPHSFRKELVDLLNDAKGRTVKDVLFEVATGILGRFRRETDLTLVMFSTAQINSNVGSALRKIIVDESITEFAAYLRGRVEAGELRKDMAVESSALIFFSSLVIFFFLHHTLPAAMWEQRAKGFISDLIHTWLEGAYA